MQQYTQISQTMEKESHYQKFRCYLIGEGTLLVSCSEYLLEQGHEICGIISANPLINQWAQGQKIPLIDPNENWVDTLKIAPFDYLFSIYSFSLIPDAVLSLPTRQAINFHDSLLPKYAGFHVTSWAIIKGEKQHGVTWHLMTEKADAGGILKQHIVDIDPKETAFEVNLKCYQAGICSFAELIDDFTKGNVDIQEQNLEYRSYFSRHKQPFRGAVVSWKASAEEIYNLSRALDLGPYPNPLGVPKFLIEEEFFIIKACSLLSTEKNYQPGEIVNIGEDGIEVAAKNGSILLKEILTIEGQVLSIRDFVERVGLQQGMILPELEPRIAKKIDVILKQTAPQEARWLKQWEDYHPLRLGWLASENIPLNFREQSPYYETFSIKISAELSTFVKHHKLENPGDFWASAFFYYLAKISQQSAFDVGYGGQELLKIFKESMGFFVPYVPLRVETESGQTFAEFLPTCQKMLKTTRQKHTYPRDFWTRYPSLQSQIAEQSFGLPVVVLEIDAPENYQSEKADIIFLIDNQKTSIYLQFNTQKIAKSEAQKVVHDFESFLLTLTLPSETLNNDTFLVEHPSSENSDFDQEKVDQWRMVYDQIYEKDRKVTEENPFFNINCWRNSYTDTKMPSEEMKEWLDCTVQRIKEECITSRILEIGCGTGLLLSRLLPDTAYYYGTDFSENAIAYIKEAYSNLEVDVKRLELSHRAADDFSDWPEQKFDTAILNSVIQYFPSLTYLKQVIAGIVQKLDAGGKCFIGDVRNSNLLTVYHGSVALFKAKQETPLSELYQQVLLREKQEEELCVEPEFFHKIGEEFPEISNVEILLKAGNTSNELTKFRYDVILHLGNEQVKSVEIPWLDWQTQDISQERVKQILRQSQPQYLGITGVPNGRILKDVIGLNYLREAGTNENVADLYRWLEQQESKGELPQDWRILAQAEGYAVALSWTKSNSNGEYDMIFRLPSAPKANLGNCPTILQSFVNLEKPQMYSVENYDIPVPYPREKRMVDLFVEQVNKSPNATALAYQSQRLTYQELHRESEQLALYLHSQGVKEGDLVGIFVQPSPEMLVSLLGVMKAGAAYLPLDPSFPQERISYILEDAQAPWLITQQEIAEKLPKSNSKTLYLEDRKTLEITEEHLVSAGQKDNSSRDYGNSLAYIIYTSGSTGKPKGVAIEHHSLTNFLCSMASEFNCNEDDYLLALTTVCFDIAALELYLPLITGGCVEVLPSEITRDGMSLRETIDSNDSLTIIQATPATWQMLLAAGWEAKKPLKLLCGGEALSEDLAKQLLQQNIALWNLYGPTETTIWSTVARIAPGDQVTIGRPIANTQCYILDEEQQPVNDEEWGELYIGGEGVARGYLGRTEETKQKFVPNPFIVKGSPSLYRTGDLVKRLPDGRLVCGGRIDFQVKLRGFRIELGEIESALRNLANVDDAVVVLREDELDKRLVAFVLDKERHFLSGAREWAEELRKWLPEYMIPSNLIGLQAYPQTLNRKIDRKYLSTVPLDKLQEDYGNAHGSFIEVLEQDLRQIVAGVLKLENTTLDPNLNIGEYGYNSLRFTTLSVKLNKIYNIRINPTLFYQHSSIKKIAKYLEDNFRAILRSYYGKDLKQTSFVSNNNTQKEPTYTSLSEEKTPNIIDKSVHKLTSKPRFIEANSGLEQSNLDEPIAIVGIGGILPGGNTLTAFWESLIQGKDAVKEMPLDRQDGDYYRQKMGEIGVKKVWGGFIDGVDRFDASFFGLSPRESELMDPRQRLLLQTVWEAIEDSGHKPADFSHQQMGVFIGATGSDYWELQQQRNQQIDGYTLSGYSTSVIANRISYLFNFKGPSLVVDTACSSSLVAVHRAIQSLKTKSCQLALAGGVNLMLSPLFHLALAKGGFLSEDGRCKTFDRSANGYVRGEGVGIVLLRPLSQALADGDSIYAVIRGSAENHSGRTNSLTAPSVDSQKELLVAAYTQSNIDPDSLSYIEVHGTGTSLGDPIEINALKEAFKTIYTKWNKEGQGKNHHCGLGALKTNIGHLESAAGIAGLLKVVLAMKYGRLPQLLHFNEQNPYVDLQGSPFRIIQESENWQRLRDDAGRELPRRAGVSSFGFGGANVHVVLEEYVSELSAPTFSQSARKNSQPCLAILSAKNEQQLKIYAEKLCNFLQNHSSESLNLRDLTYTLQIGREAMVEKAAWVVSSIEELTECLSAYFAGQQQDICIRGSSESGKKVPVLDSKEGVAFIESLAQGQRWQDIACLWTMGCKIDWNSLYSSGNKPQRLHLPSYPFATDSYWLPDLETESIRLSLIKPTVNRSDLHPLIQGQIVGEGEQIFTSILKADAFYLRDHIVDGEKVLPGVATIEMARAAAEIAEGKKVKKIRQIIWVRPIQVNDSSLKTELFVRRTDKGVDFQICGSESLIYTQGKVVYQEDFTDQDYVAQNINIAAIKQRCSRQINSQEIYTQIHRFGLDLGIGFRPLKQILVGENEALSILELPHELAEDAKKFMLHPSLMDGALQTVLGGPWGLTSSSLHIPYTIGEVEILGPVNQSCYVYAVSAEAETTRNNQGLGGRYNAYILDQKGKELVRIKSFLLRPFNQQNKLQLENSFGKGNNNQSVTSETREFNNLNRLDEKALFNSTLTDLAEMAAGILKMSPSAIVTSKNMSDYGFDSISFLELVNPINETFGLEITPDLFFEYDSLEKLANYLCREFSQQINQYYQPLSTRELAQLDKPNKDTNNQSVTSEPREFNNLNRLDEKALLNSTLTDLIEIAAGILKMSPSAIVTSKNMSDYGFDSISFLQLVNPINETFGLEITPDLFFEYDSLEKLANYLCREFSQQINQYYQPPSTRELVQLDKPNKDTNNQSVTSEPREFNNLNRLDEKALLNSTLTNTELNTANEPIAIIGMSGILAGAEDLESFWEGLLVGKDWIVEVPPSRWDWQEYYGDPMTEDNKTKSKWGGFMSEIDTFDAPFFGISPHEARLMDPQQRFLLQAVWKAVENAGLPMSALSGTKTGVFVGVANTDYGDLLKAHAPSVEAHTSTGTCPSVLANRISYLFNLRGPSLPIDTACSSSLVAVNYAVESIRSGKCDMAIAGGVNIILTPHFTLSFSKSGMLSEDGRCKTFDSRANGYARGEGVGVILLKPLNKAKADGDQIHAVIRGTAVNHGGHANSLTAPDPNSQAQVLIDAYENAGIPPTTISYIEAHGTGTSLGDPIESNGLKKAFAELSKRWETPIPQQAYCGISSVKTNTGHLEAAAGIAGILKVVLSLKYGKLPGILHFQKLNPYIRLENSPFYIVEQTRNWERLYNEDGQSLPRRAGVSSFGFGGVNAHVVLEEYQEQQPSRSRTNLHRNQAYIIVLSAKNKERLEELANNLLNYLTKRKHQTYTDIDIQNIAYTLQMGREAMQERLALVVSSLEDLMQKLTDHKRRMSPIAGVLSGSVKQLLKTEQLTNSSLVQQAIQERDLFKIAQLWVSGDWIDWDLLYLEPPQRIELPTYPFAKIRYWLPNNSQEQERQKSYSKSIETQTEEQQSQVETEIPSLTSEEEISRSKIALDEEKFSLEMYRPEWVPQSLEIPRRKSVTPQKILIVTPPESVWLESLLARDHAQDEIMWLKLGDIKTPEQWDNYLGHINALDTIYFLGGIQHFMSDDNGDEIEQLEQSQELGVFSLFRMIKALDRHLLTRKNLSLKVITCGVHRLFPDTKVYPFGATMNGMSITLSREYSSLKVSCFDLDPEALNKDYPDKEREFLIKSIIDEPAHERGQEIVLRAGQRYIRSLYPLVLPPSPLDHLRTNGVYVILGGMGGIGLTLSRYLAENYQARLILIGRSQLEQKKNAQIAALESAGASVFYGQADATDLEAMRQVIAEGKARFGSIHGVFHSALVLKDKSLATMDETTFRTALEPKVKGSVVLHHLVKEENLDFIMFFSSIQTFMGNPGQSNYGAACAFKDAYAHYLDATKNCPVYIINWGYWGSVGIVAQKSYQERLAKQGIYSIEPQEGMEVIRRILASPSHQVVAMKTDKSFQDSLGVDPQYQVEYLPESKSILSLGETLDKTLKQVTPIPGEVLQFRQALTQLEQWGSRFLLQVIQEMGELEPETLGILPQYSRLYDCVVDILTRSGFTYSDSQGKISLRKDYSQQVNLNEIETEKQQLLSIYPALKAHVVLLEKCLSNFAKILTGQCLATAVMFPNSSMTLVEGIYKGQPIAKYFNQLVAESLVVYIQNRLQQRKGDEKITILEIGAGTGGTTTTVLEAIAPYGDLIHYIYTDISLAFVNYGREQFSTLYPFTEFRVLNIEKEVSDQGFKAGDVDVVLATNVLHATQNMRRTLAHAKVLLKKNGWLILNEATAVQDFATLTFGLLSGWWLYEDETFRLPGSPLLSLNIWKNLLEKEGFRHFICLPEEEDFANLRQHIIVAESNGLIKQKISHQVARNNQVKSISLSNLSANSNSQKIVNSLDGSQQNQKRPSSDNKYLSDLSQKTEEFLRDKLAKILQMKLDEINSETAFADYGLDSILLNRFNHILEQQFGTLSKSLLLEYQTVRDLATYLLADHKQKLINLLGDSQQKLVEQKPQEKSLYFKSNNRKDSFEQAVVSDEDIAIVGLYGRYPQAENLDQFWENLKSNTSAITEIPRERWDYREFYHPEKGRDDKMYCTQGGFLTDIDKFDPIFFGITPLEAKTMNPEERIMLEVVWSTLEDAGYQRQSLSKQRVGVYLGANAFGYSLRQINGDSNRQIDLTTYNLPNRISYFFNFTGPSMVVDTSCSSSLSAVHLACESIRRKECDTAIAGGINLYLHPSKYLILNKFRLLSSQSSYSLFAKDGDGFIPGEGAGAVFLKSLRQAEADKDHIYGIIKASAMIHKGRSNDFLLPSPQAQELLVKEVIQKAGISVESISYFESQAMGSAVVDSAEWAGNNRAYRSLTDQTNFCAYGSVKPHIGHLETASGIAQLTKILLQMKHRQLLPTRFAASLDPAIDLTNSPFYLQQQLSPWKRMRVKQNGEEFPLRAAISSGGGGGMLSHLIVEEYDPLWKNANVKENGHG